MHNHEQLELVLENYKRRLQSQLDDLSDKYLEIYSNGRLVPVQPINVAEGLTQCNQEIQETMKELATVKHCIRMYT